MFYISKLVAIIKMLTKWHLLVKCTILNHPLALRARLPVFTALRD